jgi:hypothetical protein
MADHPTPSAPHKPPHGNIKVLVALKNLGVRLWALAILLVVIWTGYTAVAYLVRSVFMASRVPPQYLAWQAALDRDTLLPEKEQAALLAALRAPATHYHAVGNPLPPDPHSGCTTSGCHSPLPHTKRKEIRAFANLHATFMTCWMCHQEPSALPVASAWVSTQTGERVEAPAILRLMKTLGDDASPIATGPAAVHPVIVSLLSEALQNLDDALLNYLLVQINTSEPGSPVWRHAVEQLRQELPNHARGEYAARLAPMPIAQDYRAINRQLAEMAKRYQTAASGERAQIEQTIHANVVARPSACVACHGGEPARLDLESLGYSSQRAGELRDSPIARLMQQIQQGEPFRLPRLLEGGHER